MNMHETGLHRLGYVQVRVPCRQAHFYHLRHSYKNIALNEWAINTTNWMSSLNDQWKLRLNNEFDPAVVHKNLVKSSVESFADFDKCMIVRIFLLLQTIVSQNVKILEDCYSVRTIFNIKT